MKVIFSMHRIKRYRKPVVALGVFDGLHQGHIRILKEVVKKARSIKGTSVIVTFYPHPQKEDTIYSLEHRLGLINELGIDICIVIRFNKRFSQIPAEDFIKNILVKKIGVHHIYMGKNFKFGRLAKGDSRILQRLSHIYNFKLKVLDVIKVGDRAISSTYIRKLITRGKLNLARELLSRPVSILGTVVKGSSLGRRLGFPTANIDPHHEVLPASGVYAVSVIFNKMKFRGICYIGTKPTFKSYIAKHVEVYIFNFNRNIYGKYLEIQFIKKIREEKKFASCQCLVERLKKDIFLARKMFSFAKALQNYPLKLAFV